MSRQLCGRWIGQIYGGKKNGAMKKGLSENSPQPAYGDPPIPPRLPSDHFFVNGSRTLKRTIIQLPSAA